MSRMNNLLGKGIRMSVSGQAISDLRRSSDFHLIGGGSPSGREDYRKVERRGGGR